MAIGYVGKAFVTNTVSGTAVQVPMPSTVVTGQKIYVVVGSVGSNAGALTAPSGWTKVGEEIAGSNLRVAVFAKTATGSDASTTYTWTFPASGRTFGYSVAYSGVDLAASNFSASLESTDEGPGPFVTPSLALTAGDWLLYAAVGRENPGSTGTHNWTTSGSSDVERYDLFTNVGTSSIAIAAALWDTGAPVTTGSLQRTISSNISYSSSVMYAVRIPAAADTGTPAGGNPWTHQGVPQR